MIKTINIYIHPGYSKTGTTYLQENIFNKINFVKIGKPHIYRNELTNELILLQKKIFQSKFFFNKIYPLNYSPLIRKYVNILKRIIENTDKSDFIFSDECLFDQENYFGYFNMYLLKEILDSLKNYFNVNIKFIISIRSQHQYLISNYSYDNFFKKKLFNSFDDFINQTLTNEDLSEIYQYDILIKKIKKIFDSEVLALPLEALEQNYKNYNNLVINFMNAGKDINLNDLNNSYVNKNSELINGNRFYKIRTYDFRFNFMEYYSKAHLFLKKYKFYLKIFKYFRILKPLFEPKAKKKGKIKLSENQKKKIKKHFKQSNQNLEKILNLNVKLYDYYD